jgi:hypothetical protein
MKVERKYVILQDVALINALINERKKINKQK